MCINLIINVKLLEMEQQRLQDIKEVFNLYTQLQQRMFVPVEKFRYDLVVEAFEKIDPVEESRKSFILENLLPTDEMKYILSNSSE